MPRKELRPLSRQIRDAIDASGVPRAQICAATGINKGNLSRFMAGTAGLSQEALDKVGTLLKLQIVSPATSPAR